LYGRGFTSAFSLFIYLQDSYPESGSTIFCLQSHMCKNVEVDKEFCIESEPKIRSAYLNYGTNRHGGGENSAYDFEEPSRTRIMLILSFTSRPRPETDPRFPTLGSVYGIEWYISGHNLSDMFHLEKWNFLQGLGIFKTGDHWGWNFFLASLAAYAEYGRNDLVPPCWWFDRTIWTRYVHNLLCLCFFAGLIIVLLKLLSKSLGLFLVSSLFLNWLGLHLFHKTEFAQNILQSKRFRKIPFKSLNDLNISKDYLRSVVIPDRKDILFSERLDAYYLFHFTYFYDYHPGNRALREQIQIHRHDYLQLPLPLQNNFIETQILPHLTERNFLLQDDFGNWRIIHSEDVYNKIHQQFLATNNLYKMLMKEIRFILSQCKYGDGARKNSVALLNENTALAKTHIPGLMESLNQKLSFTFNRNNHPILISKKQFFRKIPKLVLPLRTNLLSREKKSSTIRRSHKLYEQVLQFSVPQYEEQGRDENVTLQTMQNSISYINSFVDDLRNHVIEYPDRITFNEALRFIHLCRNQNEYCSNWAAKGLCNEEKYEGFLWDNCKASCQWCRYIESNIIRFE